MATLINGNGNLAIYAQQDADWYAALMGGQTVITAVGNQFAYELLAANTIGVKDGVIITSEGRRIQLDANAIDSFEIPTGAQGTTNYYIIGYHLVTGEQSEQTCETFVQLMENGTDTIPEGSFRDGDDEVYVSLYRVEQDDLTIGTITLLLPTVDSLQEQMIDKVTKFSGTSGGNTYVTVDELAYDEINKKLGLKVNGADTVIPFSGGGTKLVGTYTNNATINVSSYGATSVNQFVCAFTGSQQQVTDGGSSFEGSGAVYGWAQSIFTPPSLNLSGNYLSLTIGTAVAKGSGGTWPTHTATIKMPVKIYYVGDIS